VTGVFPTARGSKWSPGGAPLSGRSAQLGGHAAGGASRGLWWVHRGQDGAWGGGGGGVAGGTATQVKGPEGAAEESVSWSARDVSLAGNSPVKATLRTPTDPPKTAWAENAATGWPPPKHALSTNSVRSSSSLCHRRSPSRASYHCVQRGYGTVLPSSGIPAGRMHEASRSGRFRRSIARPQPGTKLVRICGGESGSRWYLSSPPPVRVGVRA